MEISVRAKPRKSPFFFSYLLIRHRPLYREFVLYASSLVGVHDSNFSKDFFLRLLLNHPCIFSVCFPSMLMAVCVGLGARVVQGFSCFALGHLVVEDIFGYLSWDLIDSDVTQVFGKQRLQLLYDV
jgi:hypothetical protein